MAYVNASYNFSGEDYNGQVPTATTVVESSPHHTPQPEISIAWRNLRYEVTEWGFRRKPILRRLNGYFESQTLNGLMGPSGAGKSTLLNCLSGTIKDGLCVESEIFLNSAHQHSSVSYFVEQHVHESIVGRMTVGDILRYAFAFKNGPGHSRDTVEHYIGEILQELLLDDQILDRHFERCSGGEQKRIAVAQELMALEKPAFLFVDEPTTGLDSAAAYEVIHCLKRLTQKYQITVIASIHVPNDETLSLFDKLYVLSKGGVCIYSGPPQMIDSHLDKNQIQIPADQPPIESLIKIACNGKLMVYFEIFKIKYFFLT